DTGILLIGVIIVIIILIPFIFTIRNYKKKHKKEEDHFRNLGASNQLQLDNIDIINDLIIGLDKSAKKLIWAPKQEPETGFQVIELPHYKECLLQASSAKVALRLQGDKKHKVIVFYEDSDDRLPDKNYAT